MDFIEGLCTQQHAHSQRDIHRLLVQWMGWLLVQLDEASCVLVCLVIDDFSLVKLEESSWINLSELTLSWSKFSLKSD